MRRVSVTLTCILSAWLAACGQYQTGASFVELSRSSELTQTIVVTSSVLTPTEGAVPTVVRTLPVNVSPTPATRPTIEMPATRTVPPPTRGALGLPDNLPKLSTVIVQDKDYATLGTRIGLLPEFILKSWDATAELGAACLIDCSKMVFETTLGRLTIVIIRAGDEEKAHRTSTNLAAEFRRGADFEYPADEYLGLLALAPDNWAMTHHQGDIWDSVAGASRGVVIAWGSLQYDICGVNDAGERYCEGDIGYYTSIVTTSLEMQFAKLISAGY